MSAPSADTLDGMPAGHVCGCYACNPTLPPPCPLTHIDARHAAVNLGDCFTVFINGVENVACLQAYEGVNGEGWAVFVSEPTPRPHLRYITPHRCRTCGGGKACQTFIFGDVRIERIPA